MNLSEEEELERRKLVGYCETDQNWYRFTNDPDDPDSQLCPDCGSKPSIKHGYQLVTQRTFDPRAKKLTKSQMKHLGA